jgi:hypothetical protein
MSLLSQKCLTGYVEQIQGGLSYKSIRAHNVQHYRTHSSAHQSEQILHIEVEKERSIGPSRAFQIFLVN